nr:chaperonin CPN60-2, mitochondrial [Tanacetum cinerariifolium]
MPQDIPEPAQEGAAEVIEDAQRELGHRNVGVESAVTALTERVAELESDNRRLRGTAGVKSQRVDRLQRGVTVLKEDTVVLDGASDKKSIEERCEQIRSAIESSSSDYDREKFQERLAKLSGGVAVLKIGGAIDTEMPVHTIASNARVEGLVVVGKLLDQDDPDLGYDAAKDLCRFFCNMHKQMYNIVWRWQNQAGWRVLSKTYPSWEESRLEQEGEEQHCIPGPPCSFLSSDFLKGCLASHQALIPLVVPKDRIFYLEIQANEAISLSDEEIALDEAASKARSNRSGEEIEITFD